MDHSRAGITTVGTGAVLLAGGGGEEAEAEPASTVTVTVTATEPESATAAAGWDDHVEELVDWTSSYYEANCDASAPGCYGVFEAGIELMLA